MPRDHRGNELNGNHRPTPRVNQALQRYFKIPQDVAQDVIDEHRSGNDYLDDAYYGIDYSSSVPNTDNIGTRIDHIPTAISDAVDFRSGKNSRGYSSPYEYPPTVKIKD